VSLYQVQQCLYNYLRTLEAVEAGSPVPELSTSGYDLNEDEERALKAGDVGAMYLMGIHPVIINGYCRAMGYRRADYKELLENKNNEPKRKTRWQTS
jgi:hypothetical protein